MKHAATRTRGYGTYEIGQSGTILYPSYEEQFKNFGPYTWVENMMGIGLEVNLVDNWYLRQKAGAGVMSIIGEEKAGRFGPQNYTAEIAGLLNMGVFYKFR